MPERIVLVVGLAVLVAAVVLLSRQWNARRVQALKSSTPDWEALNTQPDGRTTLLAFSTPSCAACHKAQTPAIDLALTQLEDVRLIRINAASQPHAARAFGILTVPATVVIDGRGDQILAVNQGFAPSARLVEQLQHA